MGHNPWSGTPAGSPLCAMGSNQILGRPTCLRSAAVVTKGLGDHSLEQPLEQHQMLPVRTKTLVEGSEFSDPRWAISVTSTKV